MAIVPGPCTHMRDLEGALGSQLMAWPSPGNCSHLGSQRASGKVFLYNCLSNNFFKNLGLYEILFPMFIFHNLEYTGNNYSILLLNTCKSKEYQIEVTLLFK